MRTLSRLVVALGLALLIGSAAVAGTVFKAGFEDAEGYVLDEGIAGKPAATTPYWDNLMNEDALVVSSPVASGTRSSQWTGDYTEMYDASDVGAHLPGLDKSKDIRISQACYWPSDNPSTERVLYFSLGGLGFDMVFGESSWPGYYLGENTEPRWALGIGNETPIILARSADLSADAWHTAVLTVHYGKGVSLPDTCDFSVDGVVLASGLDVTSGVLTQYNPWCDDWAVMQGAIFLDDVLISQLDVEVVPELPAPAVLAAAALVLVVRRRT